MKVVLLRGRAGALLVVVAALLLAGLAWGSAGARAASGSPAPSPTGLVLKLGYLTPPENLNPFVGYTNSDYEIWSLNYDYLVGYAPDGSPRPAIAESWSTTDAGKTWIFHIRHGVTWQDGVPLTARDVAFTFNYIVKKKLAAYDFYTKLITDAVATDDYTCEVHCSAPKADMLRLYLYVFPQHIWGKIADPEKVTMTYPIIGSGPFQCVQYQDGDYAKMVRNPHYWGAKPTIDTVLFQYYTNQDTMAQEFRNGTLDGAYDVPQAQYSSIVSAPGVKGYQSNVWYLEYLSYNCYQGAASQGNPVLRDVRFRQALDWAIDKNELVRIGLDGYGRPGTTMMPPGEYPADWNAHYQPTAQETFGFDIAKANQMLDTAGYTDTNGDGFRDYKGKRIELRLWSRTDSDASQKEGKLIAGWFKRLKLKIDYAVMDPGVMSDKLYSYKGSAYAPDYDIYLWDSYGYADPGDTLAGMTTPQIEMWNDSCWSNARYDALNLQQMSELDPQKRLGFIHQMQQLAYVQTPYAVLTYPNTLVVTNTAKWDGWVPFMGQAPFFNGFNMDSYLKLRPKAAAASTGGGVSGAVWIVVGLAAAAVVVALVVVVRRRGGKEVEELS